MTSADSVQTRVESVLLPEPLVLGKPVVLRNTSTRWNMKKQAKVDSHFQKMTSEQLSNLKTDDVIWLWRDRLRSLTDACGWVSFKVMGIAISSDRTVIGISFTSEYTTGSVRVSLSEDQSKIWRVKDLDALAQYAKDQPLCLNPYSHG